MMVHTFKQSNAKKQEERERELENDVYVVNLAKRLTIMLHICVHTELALLDLTRTQPCNYRVQNTMDGFE